MLFNKIVYQFSSTAAKNKIDNSADELILANIKELDAFLCIANQSWERYSELHGIPVIDFILCSGYRCQELNRMVGGTENSPHLFGYAADITIKEKGYWGQFCIWAADFAKDCADKNILYDEIIIEGSGNLQWIHFSLYDSEYNQQMKSIIIDETDISKISSVIYGQPKMSNTQTEELSTDPMVLKHQIEKPISNYEIEGSKGVNQMDLSVMPGTYMRCIYVMKRLMTSLGLTKQQAAGVVGNILKETDGKISTTKYMNGDAGICQWDYPKQIEFRRLFLNEKFLYTANLMNQVSFLIKEIVSVKLVKKLQKNWNVNDSCYTFYKGYINKNRKLDLSNTETKKELSTRRGFSTAALEIYDTYKDEYKDEWLVGYYEGNGLADGPAIQKTDDKKLWDSHTAIDDGIDYFGNIEYLSEDEIANINYPPQEDVD